MGEGWYENQLYFETHLCHLPSECFSKETGQQNKTNLLLRVLLVGGLPPLGEPGVEQVEEGHVHGEQADHAQHHPHHHLGPVLTQLKQVPDYWSNCLWHLYHKDVALLISERREQCECFVIS